MEAGVARRTDAESFHPGIYTVNTTPTDARF